MREPATEPRRQSNREGFEERSRAILEAAVEEFCKKGYDAASISSIARTVGISDSLIYKHVESKEHLLYEAIGWRYEKVVQEIVEELKSVDGPDAKLRLFVHLHLRSWAQTPKFNLLYFHETRRAPHKYSHLISVHSTIYVHCLEDILKEGVEAGLFDPSLNLRFIRDFIIGGLDHTVWWTAALEKWIDVHALAEQTYAHILPGIYARADKIGDASQPHINRSSSQS